MKNCLDQVRKYLASEPDPQRWNRVLQSVLQELDSETATIHRLEAGSNLLRLVAQMGLPPALLPVVQAIPVGKGMAGETLASNAPVSVCNLQCDGDSRVRPGAKKTGVDGALCVPIRRAGVAIGTIGVGTRRRGEYSAAATRKLEAVAGLLGELGLD